MLFGGPGVGVGIGIATGDGDGEGSAGLRTGLGEGLGAALIATPLFQASFAPDLTQVNFFPAAVAVAPALLHLAPALGVAACTGAIRVMSKNATRVRNVHLFTTLTTYFLIYKPI